MKYIRVFYLKFSVFGGEIFYIFEQACFRNVIVGHTSADTFSDVTVHVHSH